MITKLDAMKTLLKQMHACKQSLCELADRADEEFDLNIARTTLTADSWDSETVDMIYSELEKQVRIGEDYMREYKPKSRGVVPM